MSPCPVETLHPGVHVLRGEVGGRPLLLPLLVGADAALLIDTGCASHVDSLILPGLRALGLEPERLTHLVITHCDVDHQGGNAALKRLAPRAALGCGEADASAISDPAVILAERYERYRRDHHHHYDGATLDWLRRELGAPQPVDHRFRGGERITLGPQWTVEIVHLPGHSHGHLGVHDLRHGILYGGDAIQGRVYLGLDDKPALCPTYLHVAPYRATIAHIASLPLRGYVGCHWPILRDPAAVRAFCAESAVFVDLAEARVLAALRRAGARGSTLPELCAQLGRELGAWPRAVDHELCYALFGHLTDLAARGSVIEDRSTAPFRYRSSESPPSLAA